MRSLKRRPRDVTSASVGGVRFLRRLLALAALAALVALLSACAGADEEAEIRPGPIEIGVVAAPGEREQLVYRGVQVAAAAINGFGGIGGAAPIELVVGSAERLIARGVRLLVLPCDQQRAREAAAVVERRDAFAVAPCNDGGVAASRRVVVTGLSPDAQAAALRGVAPDPLAIAPPATARGRAVHRALGVRADPEPARATAGVDAPETVRPPADAAEGVVYVTFGFPEPGNELDEFYERYKALFGARPPSIVPALGADALAVLTAAVEEAGSADPARVASLLDEKSLEVGGVLGTIELGGDSGAPEVGWVAVRVEDGRYRVVARR